MAGLDDDTLIQLLQMTAESMELDPRNVEITDELEDEVEAYEIALRDALEEVAEGFPPGSDITAEDLWDAEASYLVLMTLRGEGVGIWDGSWDDFFDEREIKEVEALLESRLHRFADDTGGGSLNEALMNAVEDTVGDEDGEGDEDDEEIDEEDHEPNKKLPLRRNSAALTYKAATAQHLGILQSMGWRVQPGLKVPWALSPDGETKLWFRPQAVYIGRDRPTHSLHVDMRSEPTEALIAEATRMHQWPV